MGKIVYCPPDVEYKLRDVCAQGPGTGLVIGSKVDDRYYGVFIVETPKEEEQGESEKKNSGVDVGWMTEHAKQVIRLLPGGLTVLGVYLFSNENVLEKQDSKIRKLLQAIQSIDQDVPSELLVVVSDNTAKVLEAKSSAFKNIDMKMTGKSTDFVRVETSVVLDIPIALPVDEKDLHKDVSPGIEKFSSMLENCIFIFENQMLDDKYVVGKSIESDKKKVKGKNKVEVQDSSDVDESLMQELVGVELLFADVSCPTDVDSRKTNVRMKIAGKISSRSYIAPGASVLLAKKAIKSDLMRSLNTRLNMHCETMQEVEEEEKKIVHEPPRRVFVSVGDPLVEGVTVSDYLYPGEGLEDCVNNMKEIFGWEVVEDSIEDDVEIVASPREVRPPSSPSESEKVKQDRLKRVPFGVVVSVGMAILSAGLAYLSFSD